VLTRSFAAQGFSTIALALAQLASVLLLSRLLTPAEFGIAATASIASIIGISLADVGFGASIVKKRTLTPQFVMTVLKVGSLTFFTVSLISFVISSFYWNDLKITKLGVIFSISSTLFGVAGIIKSILYRNGNYGHIFWVNVGSYFVGQLCLSVLLACIGFGAFAIAIGQLVTSALMLILSLWLSGSAITRDFNRRYVKGVLRFGFAVLLNRVLEVILTEGDKLFMAKFVSFQRIGHFERASRIPLIAGGHLSFLMETVLYPYMCRGVQSGQSRWAILRATLIAHAITSISMISLSFLSKFVIAVLLGPRYEGVEAVFGVLVAAGYVRVCNRIIEIQFRANSIPEMSIYPKAVSSIALISGLIYFVDKGIMTWAYCYLFAQILCIMGSTLISLKQEIFKLISIFNILIIPLTIIVILVQN